MILGSRVVIIGNSGSGKSTLARAIGQRAGMPVFDLDNFHWQDKVGLKRDEDVARRLVADVAADPVWIVEGVFGWLVEMALPRASTLIWLDMPWNVCSESLALRGPWRGATADEHAALLAWAEAYWQRKTSSSFSGHLALFESFEGFKLRLTSRSDVAELIAKS
jgi:adenylate kinase family enzyme